MTLSPLIPRPRQDRPPHRVAGPAHVRVERPRTRRGRLDPHRPGALRAALLAMLWPGAGHLYTGHWHRGLTFVTMTLGLAILALVPVTAGTAHVAGLLVRPDVLFAALVLDLALLNFRLVAVVDAYRLAGARSGRGRGSGRWADRLRDPARVVSIGGLVIVLAITALPHLAFAYYDVHAQGLLAEVFPSAAETVETSRPPAVAEGPPSPLLKRERITVLLAGGDAGPRREGLRTDTLVVVSLAVRTGEAALFSIPRNLIEVPLPSWVKSPWRCQCFPDLINNLYEWAEANPDVVPEGMDPGPTVLAGAIEELLGIPIDYHVLTDLKGFVEAVDALGGVDVTVSERIYDQLDSPTGEGEWDAIDLRPGRHHLDGRSALVYVRTRRDSSDYARIDRQRCFLAALASQTDAGTLLRAFPRLAAVARRSLQTDFPVEALPDLVKLATRVDIRGVVTVAFTPPTYMRAREDGYPVPDVYNIKRTVAAMLRAPQTSTSVLATNPEESGVSSERYSGSGASSERHSGAFSERYGGNSLDKGPTPSLSPRARTTATEPPPGPRTIADTCG
ncbi:MAG: LCP family protein [Actinomycetota bacterium]|nr:LCP family protein [Actinomycetota bacterium]